MVICLQMFKKQTYEAFHLPDLSQLPSESLEHRIISSVEALDLDPSRFIIVGSAAIALYGIAPPEYVYDPEHPRPHDVDLATGASAYAELIVSGRTPSGVPLVEKPILSKVSGYISRATPVDTDVSLLPVDIITRFNPIKNNPKQYDEGFHRYFSQHSIPLPGSSSKIRVASPHYIEQELVRNSLDPKYALDLATFRRHKHRS